MFPVFDATDLAEFTGRPASSYKSFTDQSIKQALLLFRLATCLTDWPTDELEAELAENAVLAMADSFYLGQQFAKAKASPFQSESIGSYSYTLKQVRNGEDTGIMWFDEAIKHLGVCDTVGVGSGSIQVFTHDELLVHNDATGETSMVGPKDRDLETWQPDPTISRN